MREESRGEYLEQGSRAGVGTGVFSCLSGEGRGEEASPESAQVSFLLFVPVCVPTEMSPVSLLDSGGQGAS